MSIQYNFSFVKGVRGREGEKRCEPPVGRKLTFPAMTIGAPLRWLGGWVSQPPGKKKKKKKGSALNWTMNIGTQFSTSA
jgi:hypothetical protein